MNWISRAIPQSGVGAFWLGFGACLVICLLIVFVVAPLTGVSQEFGPGHDGYIELAENIGQGNGYVFEEGGPPVFHRPPLYPVLLVPITYLPKAFQRPGLILLHSVMVGIVASLVFGIGRRLFGSRTGGVGVVVLLVSPWLYWNAKNPMTVILQGMLYTLFAALVGGEILAVLDRAPERPGRMSSPARTLCIAVVGAALALTHAAMLAVSIVGLAGLFVVGVLRRRYKPVVVSIAAAVIMAGLIGPWTYRNWVTFGRFIPVSGGAGLAYFNGNVHWKCIEAEPQRNGETYIDASLRVLGIEGTEKTVTHWKGFTDIELEDKANEKMIEHIRTHSGVFAKKFLLNAVEYYFPAFVCRWRAVKDFGWEESTITVFNLAIWILALVGFLRSRKEDGNGRAGWLILSGVAIYAIWYLPFATFITHSLYKFGTVPLLSILAARGLVSRKRPVVYLSQTSAS